MEEAGARLQELWDGILDLTSKFVIPDWGSLVALLPIFLLAVIILYFAWTLYRVRQLGPRRRGVRRIPPVPPPGVHAGHGSFAPILAAIGAAAVFAGLVIRGWFLVGAIAVLIVTLLYWGREALREYDQLEGRVETGPGGTAALTPPPGVHLPAPSFRPILVSAAVALLFVGLVAGPWIMLAGLVFLVVSLLGWLRDARREYADLVAADQTGRPPHPEAPGYPVGTIALIAVILVGAIVLDTGLLPPRNASAGGPGGSPAASAPAGGGGPGGGSAGPSAGPSGGAAGEVTIEAKGIAFVQTSVTAPAGKPFTIAFDNEDAGIPHNIQIKDASGGSAFKGEIVTGVTQTTYDVPALGPGTYTFVCDVHPSMTGTLTVQ